MKSVLNVRAEPRRQVQLLAVTAALLAVAHGFQAWLQAADTAYLAVLSGFAATLGILAAARLWWSNCVESRLVTAAVALGTLLGHLLVAAVGLPGQPETAPPGVIEFAIVTLSGATLLLLVLSEAHLRPPPGQGHRAPGPRGRRIGE